MANPGFETNGISANPPSDGDPSGGQICRGIIDILRDAINRGGGGTVRPDLRDIHTGSLRVLPDTIISSLGNKRIDEEVGIAVGRSLRQATEQKPYLELPNCFPSTLIESLTERLNLGTEDTDPAAEDTDPAADETDPAADETDPAAEETDPAAEETDPAAEETDPAAEETDPATESGADRDALSDNTDQSDHKSQSLGAALGLAAADAVRWGDIGEFSSIKVVGQTLGEAATRELGTPGHASTGETGRPADNSTLEIGRPGGP